MKTLQFACAGAVSLAMLPLMAGNAGAAALVIDDYNTGSVNLTTTLAAPTILTSNLAGLSGVVGGVRNSTFTKTLGVSASNRRATLIIDGPGVSTLNIDNANGTNSTANIAYSGLGDLSMYDSFRFKVQNFDTPGNGDVTLTLTVNGVTGSAVPITTSVLDGQPPVFAEALFSDFVGVDFTNVTSLSYLIAGPAAFDIELDSFIVATTAPEPATMLGVAAAMGAGFMTSRKGKKKAHK